MSMRILLIEDNPDHVKIAKRILEKTDKDYQIDSVNTGQQGLKKSFSRFTT